MILTDDDPLAVSVTGAIRGGRIEELKRLLAENAGLATARVRSARDSRERLRTLLHIASDWPGNFPNASDTVQILVAAGADVNARFGGSHSETPLHWAASCDDVAVLDALLEAGANIEADGAVIGGGTPLADAVAFGQWKAARRLVTRGANTALWEAAALGLSDRVDERLASTPPPSPAEITSAFWCACHGGQKETAESLLKHGADLNWVGYDKLTPVDAAIRSQAHE